MPRSRKQRGEDRAETRERAVERSGGFCEWSGCNSPIAHMAHIEGIGRGGDPLGIRDVLGNVAMLCVYHHDLLDGRTTRFRLREVEQLLTEVIELRSAA